MRQYLGTFKRKGQKKAYSIFKQGNDYFLVCDGIVGTFKTFELAKQAVGIDPLDT